MTTIANIAQQESETQNWPAPWLMVLVGFMGCGKTTVGQMLAQDWQTTFIDLDQEISQAAAMPIAAVFAKYGEMQFRQWEQETLKMVLARYPLARNPLLNKEISQIIAQPTNPALDSSAPLADCDGSAWANSLNPALRLPVASPELLQTTEPRPQAVLALGGGTWVYPVNRQLLQNQALSIWLNCSLAVTLTRLKHDNSRPLANNPAQLADLWAARLPSYQLANYHLDVTNLSPTQTARVISTYPLF